MSVFADTNVGSSNCGTAGTTSTERDRPDPTVYMHRFKEHAAECIGHAYDKNTSVHRSTATGVLTSSLAEDVVSLVDTLRNVLQDFLASSGLWSTQTGNAIFVDGLCFVVQCLKNTQRQQRAFFLTTLEDCCQASNDFFRMSEKMERLLDEIHRDTPFSKTISEENFVETPLTREWSLFEWSQYVTMLSQDAVFCAEHAHVFIMRTIKRTSIPSDLFSKDWEDRWTHNEVALNLIKTVDRFLLKMEQYFSNDYCWNKALLNLCKAVVCFYVRCLVERADSVSRRRSSNQDRLGREGERKPFQHSNRALIRMMGDIIILKEFFLGKTDGNVALGRIISNEIYVLELIHECLDATDEDSLEAFIVVIHKRTGADALVTRHFVRDLWMLVAHDKGKARIDEAMMVIQQDLHMVSAHMKEHSMQKKTEVSFVRLDEMLKALYEDRLVQGTLPVCWTCIPKCEADDGNENVNKKIRKLTRSLAEIRWM